jgi:hypothetical protein
MSGSVFAQVVLAGAALIALWIDVRFPKLMPGGRKLLLNIGCALLLGQIVVPVTFKLLPPDLGVMLVALPSLTYLLLTTIWFIKHVQQMLPGRSA